MTTALIDAPTSSSRETLDDRQGPVQSPERPVRLPQMVGKIIMAITGAGLIGFVLVHLLGNLQIYLGAEALNSYAARLKSMPALLWTARLGLIAMFVAHIGSAIYLRRANRRARVQRYAVNHALGSTLASRTMFLSGMTIAAFLIYHLMHFTLGITDAANYQLVDDAGRHDVFGMVVRGFSNIYVSAAYVIAMLFLGMHLSHASASMFQTLGFGSGRHRVLLNRAAVAFASLIVIGNVSIPFAVLLGLVAIEGGAS